jgi:hypothetical protein
MSSCRIGLPPMIEAVRWTALELEFEAQQPHVDPYRTVELDVTFTHQSGLEMTLPAFWNGGDCWKSRFAPTELGVWSFQTHCSDEGDTGLHLQRGEINVAPYSGELALYRHGFLRVSENRRYLEHADGTPFYWLGDTHWLGLCAKERFEESNDPRFASQFRGIIERRLEQGYTVWAGSLMIGEWNDASGSSTPLWGTHLEHGEHPWIGTGYQITASSGVHQADFTGLGEGHAIDGYADSRWESKLETFPQWLRLDLGVSLPLGRIELKFPASEAWAYRIEGSNNDQDFDVLLEHDAGLESDVFAQHINGTYRFVRLVMTGSGGSRASLNAFHVFDTDGRLHGNQNVLKVLNAAYWQLLDRRIQFIAESGLLLNLGLDWGRNLQHSPAMLEDYKRVARYVLARYGAYPSVYFTAGEPQQSTLDPYKRPMTLHTFKPIEARGFKPDLAVLQMPVDRKARGFGFLHLQTEEYGQGDHQLEEWSGEYHATPTMPMIEAETGYEKDRGDGYEQRWSAWQSQMSGACGYTYGAYGIWSATWDNDDHWNTFGTHVNWFEAIDFVGGDQMRHVSSFFQAIPWQTLEPAPNAIHWKNAPTTSRERPLHKAARDATLIVAYLPRSDSDIAYSGRVNGLDEKASYRAEWFDPRNGTFSSIETDFTPLAQGWITPLPPDLTEDWILLVKKNVGLQPVCSVRV